MSGFVPEQTSARWEVVRFSGAADSPFWNSLPIIREWCYLVHTLSGCSSNDNAYTQQIERGLATFSGNHTHLCYIYLRS